MSSKRLNGGRAVMAVLAVPVLFGITTTAFAEETPSVQQQAAREAATNRAQETGECRDGATAEAVARCSAGQPETRERRNVRVIPLYQTSSN